MTIDIYLRPKSDGRVGAIANTTEGEEFVDAWTGSILEVVDSGRIVIPSGAAAEFTAAAERDDLQVEEEE